MNRSLGGGLLLLITMAGAPVISACQSPTDPDDTPSVDDFLETSVSPNPAIAGESTDGRTYRVVRGNNQPDEILRYDWKTSFSVTARLNDKADDEDYLTFPVTLTSATVTVKQASGGIVTPPTGGELRGVRSRVHLDHGLVRGATDDRDGIAGGGIKRVPRDVAPFDVEVAGPEWNALGRRIWLILGAVLLALGAGAVYVVYSTE
jgi:hypothetical protein